MDKVQQLLGAKKIKPSITRVKILEYLIKHATHPSVEEIYSNLVGEIPTLSKTTVYNTLNLFEKAELVRALDLGDNESRYDASVADHGHFKCNKCGHVYDFWFNIDNLDVKGLDGFKVFVKNVYCRGVCPRCLSD